jgi:hypothetical protein
MEFPNEFYFRGFGTFQKKRILCTVRYNKGNIEMGVDN